MIDKKYKINLLCLSFIVICILLLVSPVLATTWYVDYSGGANTNNGITTATPFKHCPGDANANGAAASTALHAGDRVIFKGGIIYSGTINTSWSGSGDGDASRVIYDGDSGTYGSRWASGSDKAIIDGGMTRSSGFVLGSHSYITINNFEIRNMVKSASAIAIDGGSGSNTNYITVSYCTIHDNGDDGFVSGVYNHSPAGFGIVSGGSYWKVLHNTLYNNYDTQIRFYGGQYNEFGFNTFRDKSSWALNPCNQSHLTIHDNTFADCGHFYLPYPPHVNLIWLFMNNDNVTSDDIRIYNNLMYLSGTINYPSQSMTAGIQLATNYGQVNVAYKNVYIYNNILSNIPGSPSAIDLSSKDVSYTNVYIYNNSINQPIASPGIGLFGSSSGYLPFTNVYIMGNSIRHTVSSVAIIVPSTKFTNMVIDYNNYYSTMSSPLVAGGDNNIYYNWSGWKALGYDLHGKGLTSDPLYSNADATHWDLSIPSTSPLHDSFSTSQAPIGLFSTDIMGTPRPQGSSWDIGAYENVNADTISPSSPTMLR
jgi:hypothetical protein